MVHEESSNKKTTPVIVLWEHSENHPFPHGTHESHIFSESDTTSINRKKYYNEMFEITSSFHNNLSH
jgi:CDGSH-type Zn-finger protein